MELSETLKGLGFSEKQARVYLVGLELGPASVQALAIKSGIKRTTVYQVVEELKERKLFSETRKGKKRLFTAAHPNQLKAMENERQQLLEHSFSSLLAISNVSPGRPRVQYYDSLQGIQYMYETALNDSESDTIGVADAETTKQLDETWLDTYVQKRKKKDIASQMVLVDSADMRKWRARDSVDARSSRMLPIHTDMPVNIEVVGETVLITSLKGETLGLSIQSRKVAAAMRSLLAIVWDSAE